MRCGGHACRTLGVLAHDAATSFPMPQARIAVHSQLRVTADATHALDILRLSGSCIWVCGFCVLCLRLVFSRALGAYNTYVACRPAALYVPKPLRRVCQPSKCSLSDTCAFPVKLFRCCDSVVTRRPFLPRGASRSCARVGSSQATVVPSTRTSRRPGHPWQRYRCCTGCDWIALQFGLTRARAVQVRYCGTHAVRCPSSVKAPITPSILST